MLFVSLAARYAGFLRISNNSLIFQKLNFETEKDTEDIMYLKHQKIL